MFLFLASDMERRGCSPWSNTRFNGLWDESCSRRSLATYQYSNDVSRSPKKSQEGYSNMQTATRVARPHNRSRMAVPYENRKASCLPAPNHPQSIIISGSDRNIFRWMLHRPQSSAPGGWADLHHRKSPSKRPRYQPCFLNPNFQ